MSRWIVIRPTRTITGNVQSISESVSSFTAEINCLLGDAVTVKPVNKAATLLKNLRGKVTATGTVTVSFDAYKLTGMEQLSITVAPAPITVTDNQYA